MILDQITLAGLDAYLRADTSNEVNVVAAARADLPEAGVVRRARSLVIGEGMLVRVTGVQIYLECDDLLAMLPRSSSTWLSLRVEKEMFPGLFKNPYGRRTHRIAGFEDLSRGMVKNLRVMEVEGVATLVSTGAEAPSFWRSPIFTMPDKIPIDAVAWEMPTHKDTPATSFDYDLDLRTWIDDPKTTAPNITNLAVAANPQSPRFRDLEPLLGARHYQFELRARVKHDAPLLEHHVSEVTKESLGRPLLSAIYLLETVPAAHSFSSLTELMAQSAGYELFGARENPPRRFMAKLDLSATLAKGESITLDIHGDAPGLTVLEARLEAEIVVRPPRTEVGR